MSQDIINFPEIKSIATAILNHKQITIFTGAGISVESGINPYRGHNGIWQTERKKLSSLSTAELYKYFKEKYKEINIKQPNATHFIIRRLQQINPNIHVITQNVDNLHNKANNINLIELHGNITNFHCEKCHTPSTPSTEFCPKCSALIRPNITWFNEQLNTTVSDKAVKTIQNSNIFISLGTSAQVYPAANLILHAIDLGIPTYEINPLKTEITQYTTKHFNTTSSEFLTALQKSIISIT
jgi:NAD-dependent deacetylase